jgi:repressor LexA
MTNEQKPALTERQRLILEFIDARSKADSRPPTIREIAAAFRISSPKGVSDHLRALEKKGYLNRTAGKSRGLTLLSGSTGIPLVGSIAAGSPITAIENREGVLDLEALFGKGDLFAVRVQGDSMTGCGIHHGDFIVVRRSPTVEHRAIGVAYIDGEATVKRILKTSTGYRLQPENPDYKPIDVDEGTPGFAIGGPVIGVLRSYRAVP